MCSSMQPKYQETVGLRNGSRTRRAALRFSAMLVKPVEFCYFETRFQLNKSAPRPNAYKTYRILFFSTRKTIPHGPQNAPTLLNPNEFCSFWYTAPPDAEMLIKTLEFSYWPHRWRDPRTTKRTKYHYLHSKTAKKASSKCLKRTKYQELQWQIGKHEIPD